MLLLLNMTKIQELQKKIKGIRGKILKLKTTTLSDANELNKLINEEAKILKGIEQIIKKEKSIYLERKKLPRYTVEISYTDRQREKLKKESERKDKFYQSLKNRPSKKKIRLINKLKKLRRKSSNKGRVKIKTSFEILRKSSYKPQPINRQAARAVGYRIKKK